MLPFLLPQKQSCTFGLPLKRSCFAIRLLFSIATLLLFLGCGRAQNSPPTGGGLYPFRCGEKWGFSNSNGVVQVPCKYDLVTFEEDFYTAYNSDLQATIFNASGQITDQVDAIFKYDDSLSLLLTKLKNPPAGVAATQTAHWGNFYGRAWLRRMSEKKVALPDTVLKIHDFAGLLWTHNGSQQGIYSIAFEKYLIPLQPQPIQYIADGGCLIIVQPNGTFNVTNLQGFKFELPANAASAKAILDNRYFVLSSPKHNDIVYKLTGEPVVSDTTSLTELREPEENTIIAWLAPKKGKAYASYDLYDANGVIVANNIFKAQPIWKNTVLIDYLDTTESRFQYNMRVVDMVTHKILLSALTPHTRIEENKGFLIVDDTSGKQTIYYAGTGKRLLGIPYLEGYPEKQVVQVMLTRKSYDGTNRSIAFYALRKDTTASYTVFDANGTIVNADYEALYDYENRFVIAKKKGKSTLLNPFWKEVLPPVYDDIQPEGFNAFRVMQHGKKFMVDTNGNTLRENNVSPVMTTALKGWHLLLERQLPNGMQLNEVTKATVKNAAGTEIASWADPKSDYEYMLTPNGKIMRYSSVAGNPIQAFNPQTQKVESVSYDFESLPVPDLPLVFVVQNKKGETGILSTLDFKMIVPAGKYASFKIFRNPKRPNGMLEGVFIRGINKQTSEAETIGYYGINGVTFWKD